MYCFVQGIKVFCAVNGLRNAIYRFLKDFPPAPFFFLLDVMKGKTDVVGNIFKQVLLVCVPG
jgi:hypothetical protein